jgi:hypothetical protein
MLLKRIVVNGIRIEYDANSTDTEISVEKDWNSEAKGIVKAEIARRHLTYKDLVDKLRAIGVDETEANLRNKISRGGFSAGFFVQCLTAIGAHSIRIHEPD